MSMIPSVSKVKGYALAVVGLAITAYAMTRLTPGLARFVGLNPGGPALPNGSILTPPNVPELMGRAPAVSDSASQAALYSPFNPQGRNNIMDAILA